MVSQLSPFKINYTVDQAADALGIGRSTLYEAVREGKLAKGKFLGRTVFVRDELERFWRENFNRAA